MKFIWSWVRAFALFSFLIFFSGSNLFAEGSWQMGLKQGLTYEQSMFQWDSSYSSTTTGLELKERPLYVDINNTSEIINIHVCGNSNTDDLTIEIYDENATTLLDSITLADSNVDCTDDFNGILTGGYEFTPGAAGTYQIRLDNLLHTAAQFRRFDVFVKADASMDVDPRIDQGRLWAYRLAFDAGSYNENESTSANLYAVVDGGFTSSYYVWELNLDHFAGYVYELTANDLGLTSPNADGTIVASLSGCIDSDTSAPCATVSGNRNYVDALYRLYLSNPAASYPRPTTLPEITNFRFLDDEGQDDSISPSDTVTVQDTGNFFFATNLATTGTYTIIIDINQDDVFGLGDVFLNGPAIPGDQNVSWNGIDNSGNPIPNGNYKAQIILKTGEFHFTAADAETSGGDTGHNGLTINAVLDDGTVDTSNKVYWDDSTYLGLAHADSYNGDGVHKYHNWGTFSETGDGNKAYLDTYTIGNSSVPIFIRLAIEPDDAPRTKIIGNVFDDANGNGVRDASEVGFNNITVALTEPVSGDIFYVSTDSNGSYEAYTSESSITIDVNESMLPGVYVQTAGTDPETIALVDGVENNVGIDGYQAAQGSVTVEKTGTFMDENGDGYADVGETIHYNFTVTNTGNVPLTNVILTDNNAVITGGPIAVLAVGATDTTTFSGIHIITMDDIIAGVVINQAVVTAKDPQGNDVNDTSDDPQNPVNDDSNGDGEPDDETSTGLPIEPPVSTNDTGAGATGQDVTIDIVNNDNGGTFALNATTVTLTPPVGATGIVTDVDGDTTGFVVPGEGTWSVDETTGEVTFSPEAGYIGDPTPIEYTIEDTQGNPTTSEISINYPPVANDDEITGALNELVTLNVLANDHNTTDPLDPTTVRFIDPSGNEVTTLTVPGEGTWTVDTVTGEVTFDPDMDFTGDASAPYVVRETNGDVSNEATITVHYPVTRDDTLNSSNPGGTSETVSILDNDADGIDPTTIQIVGTDNPGESLTVAGEGVWSIDPTTGNITFIPEPDFLGDPTPIEYTVEYNGVRVPPVTVSITYTVIDPAPVPITPPLATDNLDIPITHYGPTVIDVLANGDTWGSNGPGTQVFIFTQPIYGTVALDDGGTPNDPTDDVLIYTPAPDKNNIRDSFTYTITDAAGNTATATVTLNVKCASSQTSDGGDALGMISMLMMMFFTAMAGLYFVRKEEERGEA